MRRTIPLLLLAVGVLGGCVDIPRSDKRKPVRQSTGVVTPSPQGRQCLAALGATQAAFTPLPDKHFGGGCSNVNTVRLASVRGDYGMLSLANLGPVTCPMANAFSGWARFGVDRAARQILGSPLATIETFGSYNCRNVAGTSRRSAHSTADAIDVSGFVLADGRRITLTGNWSSGTQAERRFLRVVQQSACKRFGTVLGPEYNSAHRDHFHLEISGSNFCR